MGGTHYIWNDIQSQFDEIDNFSEICHEGIYVSSTNKIILFTESDQSDDVESDESEMNDLWEYCIDSRKYKKIESITVNSEASIILTKDEKYMIVAGGHSNDSYIESAEETDSIFVIDMINDNKYELKQSKICCPKPGSHHMV